MTKDLVADLQTITGHRMSFDSITLHLNRVDTGHQEFIKYWYGLNGTRRASNAALCQRFRAKMPALIKRRDKVLRLIVKNFQRQMRTGKLPHSPVTRLSEVAVSDLQLCLQKRGVKVCDADIQQAAARFRRRERQLINFVSAAKKHLSSEQLSRLSMMRRYDQLFERLVIMLSDPMAAEEHHRPRTIRRPPMAAMAGH